MLDWEWEAVVRALGSIGEKGLNCLSAECSIGSHTERKKTMMMKNEVSIAFRLNARLGGDPVAYDFVSGAGRVSIAFRLYARLGDC